MPAARFATFNIWNSDHRQEERLHACAEVLNWLNADVVALQEVPSSLVWEDDHGGNAVDFLHAETTYEHAAFQAYPGNPGEGLAFLSKYPMDIAESMPSGIENFAFRVTVDIGGAGLALTNMHLDWASIANRERQIVDIVGHISERPDGERYEVLLGDFNCHPESSVYQFVTGQQTLLGQESEPWHDLARGWAETTGANLATTLDFGRNPRWRDSPKVDRPARVDWLLLRDTFKSGLAGPALTGAGIFGEPESLVTGVVPSDHYGVYADLVFPD